MKKQSYSMPLRIFRASKRKRIGRGNGLAMIVAISPHASCRLPLWRVYSLVQVLPRSFGSKRRISSLVYVFPMNTFRATSLFMLRTCGCALWEIGETGFQETIYRDYKRSRGYRNRVYNRGNSMSSHWYEFRIDDFVY